MLETKRVSVLEIFYDFVFVTGLFTKKPKEDKA